MFAALVPVKTELRLVVLAVMLLLSLSSVLPVVLQRSLFKIQVWGLIPLGLLVGLLACWGLIAVKGTLDSFPACFLLLVVTGLVFARRNGLSASLFVLAGGIITAQTCIEPGMYLGQSPMARFLVGDGMIVLFWILTPIVVLRSRSVLGQAVGLLLPMVAYAAIFVFALSSASGLTQPFFQLSLSQSISVASPIIALFVTVVLAAPVYVATYAKDFTLRQALHDAAGQGR